MNEGTHSVTSALLTAPQSRFVSTLSYTPYGLQPYTLQLKRLPNEQLLDVVKIDWTTFDGDDQFSLLHLVNSE